MKARAVLLALLCACGAAFAQQPAGDTGRRAQLAREIVEAPQSAAGVQQMDEALADVLARPVLRNLRKTEGWGPNAPSWQQLFPAFRDEFLQLAQRLAPTLSADLTTALAEQLTPDELTEVLGVQRDPRLGELQRALREIGLDSVTLVRIAGMSRAPELYSEAEQKAMAQQLLGLGVRQQELVQQHPELDAILQALRKPAMLKYQAAISGVLSAALRRIEADAASRQEAAAFLAAWRDRLKDD